MIHDGNKSRIAIQIAASLETLHTYCRTEENTGSAWELFVLKIHFSFRTLKK